MGVQNILPYIVRQLVLMPVATFNTLAPLHQALLACAPASSSAEFDKISAKAHRVILVTRLYS